MRRLSFLGGVLALLLGLLGLPAPLSASAASVSGPDPFFGTWSDGMSPTPQDARAFMDRQTAAGVGLMRQYVWGDRIERSPGSYEWSRPDQLVADATAHGMSILATLLYPPSFYSSKPADSTSTAQFPPSDPQTMARFAEAMVARYKPGGSYWCTPSLVPLLLPPPCKSEQHPIT